MYFRATTLILMAAAASASAVTTTVTFEDKSLASNSFYNGSDNAGGWSSGGVGFNNAYDPDFGWSGWSYSNTTDTKTAGFGNQYSAVTGGGVGGSSNYAVAFDGGGFGLTPTINLPAGRHATSVQITNTTYAYLAVKDGNDGNTPPFVRQFGANAATPQGGDQGVADTFTVTFTGYSGANATGDVTGTTLQYLADYRATNNSGDYVLNAWTPVDLTGLGNAQSITLTLDSTDKSYGFNNTPTYLAIDNLTVVPEPASIAALALVGAALLRRKR